MTRAREDRSAARAEQASSRATQPRVVVEGALESLSASSLSMSQRGHTKSFKIHFEEYVQGQRFRCVDRLSLNNNFKDPSMMREHLANALAADLGLEAPRTAYAEVTVNGELHGVFTMVQQIDHRFFIGDRLGTARAKRKLDHFDRLARRSHYGL